MTVTLYTSNDAELEVRIVGIVASDIEALVVGALLVVTVGEFVLKVGARVGLFLGVGEGLLLYASSTQASATLDHIFSTARTDLSGPLVLPRGS